MRKLVLSMAAAACMALPACKSPPKPVTMPDAGQQPSEDAGNPTACTPGVDLPEQNDCAPGCVRFCESTGKRGPCQLPGGACPSPSHALASCEAGPKCGRGPCDPDYFDFDPNIFGCETYCKNRQCTLADGGTITLSNDPLHERSMAFHALSSGASFGDVTQRSDAGYQNVGTLGELAVGASSSDGGYTNYGGFLRASQRP
jgi:hypothetical protein